MLARIVTVSVRGRRVDDLPLETAISRRSRRDKALSSAGISSGRNILRSTFGGWCPQVIMRRSTRTRTAAETVPNTIGIPWWCPDDLNLLCAIEERAKLASRPGPRDRNPDRAQCRRPRRSALIAVRVGRSEITGSMKPPPSTALMPGRRSMSERSAARLAASGPELLTSIELYSSPMSHACSRSFFE